MTGRYHYRTRVVDTYIGRSMMDPEEITLPQILSGHGYRTGIFGKWHLGDCYPMRAMDKGFTESVVHNGGGIGQPGDYEGKSYFDPVLFHNGSPRQYQGYCTDIFFDEAIRFIGEDTDSPFFAYIATNAPHSPLHVEVRWVERYRRWGVNGVHAKVYGMVQNIDDNIGKLLRSLEASGRLDNTLILFTSDHGPCTSAQFNGQTRFNAGMRGNKGQMYDGGIRVPMFWRWPTGVPKHAVIKQITHVIDLFPTIISACDVELPQGLQLDGVDLAPLLRPPCQGENQDWSWPDRHVFMQWHRGDMPIRYRNYAVIGQRYKLLRNVDIEPDQLFDLLSDPNEERDLAKDHADLVQSMRHMYDLWFDDVSATRGTNNYDPPLIHVGSDHQRSVSLTRQDWRIHGEDGWEDAHYGHWDVIVDREGRYNVLIKFTAAAASAHVYFRLNDQQAGADVEVGAKECKFVGVKLPCGPTKVEAWISDGTSEDGAGKRSVRYVYIESQ